MSEKYDKTLTKLLLLIILLGFFLRVYNLSSESVWLDEAITVLDIKKPTLTLFFQSIIGFEGNPPLYFLFLRYWTKIFGTSEFAIRIPSAIFGTLSIWTIFLIGNKLFDKKTGLLSALVFSTSMQNILYSQEARTYSLFVLLATVSTLNLIKSFKKGKDNKSYIISTILMMYTHYLGIILCMMQIFVFFLFQRKIKLHSNKFIFTQFKIIISYLPALLILIPQVANIQKALKGALSLKLGFPAFVSKLGFYNFFIPIIIIFLISYMYRFFGEDIYKKIKNIRFNQVLFLAITLIFFVFYIIFSSRFTHSIFLTRYTLFTYPFFYILFVRGFTKLNKNYKLIITIFFILTTIFSLISYYHLSIPRKEQWRDAASYIDSLSSEKELIIIVHQDLLHSFNYYYKGSVETIGFETFIDYSENMEQLVELKEQMSDKDGYWLILSHAYKAQGMYEKFFNENYRLLSEKHLVGIDIYHYN